MQIKQESTVRPAATPPSSQRVELFGAQVPSNFGEVPKYKQDAKLRSWRVLFEAHFGTLGLQQLLLVPATTSWNEALAMNHAGVKVSTLRSWYVTTATRMCYSLTTAVAGAGVDREQLLADAAAGKPNDGIILLPGDDGELFELPLDANPYAIMETLRAKLELRTPYAAIGIYRELNSIRWDRGRESGARFLQRFRAILSELDRLVASDRPKPGEALSETMKAIIALEAMPESMATEVKVLANAEAASLQQVEALLLRTDDQDAAKKRHAKKSATEAAHAFYDNGKKPAGKPFRQHDKRGNNKPRDRRDQRRTRPAANDDDDSPATERKQYTLVFREVLPEPVADEADYEQVLATRFSTNDASRCMILDSGASRHMWSLESQMENIKVSETPIIMQGVTGAPLKVYKTGTVQLTSSVRMAGVMLVPSSGLNLLSVNKITEAGHQVTFDGDKAIVWTDHVNPNKRQPLLTFKKQDGCSFDISATLLG